MNGKDNDDINIGFDTSLGDNGGMSGMMRYPLDNYLIIAVDRYTYEMAAIRGWLRENDASLVTEVVMDHMTLIPNYLMLSMFDDPRHGTDRYRRR